MNPVRCKESILFTTKGLLILCQTIARQKNDALFLTDLQTTLNDPGSRYASTNDPGSVLVPGQAKDHEILASFRTLYHVFRVIQQKVKLFPFVLQPTRGDLVQIIANTAVKHQIGVAHRVAMQQPGQLGSLGAVPRDLIFDAQTVDIDQCPIGITQLHALGIFMILTANQSPHRASSFYIFPIFDV